MGETLSLGRSYHIDYGEFYIGGETSTWGRRHLHDGGDFIIAVVCLPPETSAWGRLCTVTSAYGTRCGLPRTPGDQKLLTAVSGSRQLRAVVLVITYILQLIIQLVNKLISVHVF